VPPAARTATTLAVLVALLIAGLAWGWSAATSPLPEATDEETCRVIDIAEGEQVYPDQVVVSVLNAGTREGLASRTMQLFVDQGFVAGERDNAPDGTEVQTAEIWTEEPDGPTVRLVRSWLGKNVEVRTQEASVDGVVVVVGDQFTDLVEGRSKLRAKVATSVCIPPESDVIDPTDDEVTS